jgi:hypothetical protein
MKAGPLREGKMVIFTNIISLKKIDCYAIPVFYQEALSPVHPLECQHCPPDPRLSATWT